MVRTRRMAVVTDMTNGSSVGKIVRFSMPLVFGNLFQQLYGMVDAVVVGQFVSVEALAAIGCITWVTWLIIAFIRDVGDAFSITASVAVGGGDERKLARITGNAFFVCAVLGAGMTVSLLALSPWIIRVLRVPENIADMTGQYLTIFVLTIPFGMVFNIVTSLMRAHGNSGVTFAALSVSTAVNVVLDLVFVIGLGLGVFGAAAATWIAQGAAMAVALAAAARDPAFRVGAEERKPDPAFLAELARVGLPLCFNSAIIGVGGLVVVHETNQLGSSFAAGITACSKIYNLCEAVILAFQTGLSVYVGQNLGAGLISRLRGGMNRMIVFGLALTAGMIAAVFVSGQWVLPLFLSADNPETYARAMQVAVDNTWVLMLSMLLMTPMYYYRVTIQTLGHSGFAACGGAVQMVVRIITVFVGPAFCGEWAYFLHDGTAWLFALPVVAAPCYVYLKRFERLKSHRAGAR